MSNKYLNILKPLSINGVVIKNRLLASNSLPHFLQGPESFPSESVINHLAGIAKNGAGIVTLGARTNKNQRIGPKGDIIHFPMWDLSDPSVENYFCHMSECVHFHGSLLSIAMIMPFPADVAVCNSFEKLPLEREFRQKKAITRSQMDEAIENLIKEVEYYKNCCFDMVTLHMSYQAGLLARMLSPITNKRTDEYGGSIENRSRYPLKVCSALKQVFGPRFLVEAQISGEEDGGITLEDTVKFAQLAENKVDILQIRAGDVDLAHPTGFNSEKGVQVTLRAAEAIKRSGANIITAPIGGFQDPDEIDGYLADGKADMIGMARAFVCDSEYGQKIEEGRGDDVVPCIRCNRCHGLYKHGPYITACSVNPVFGIANEIDKMVSPARGSKNIAVIGGGPAGMEAAITAAKRGHRVTLFEKEHVLGGQLIHSEYMPFKWPIKDFKDYLIRQLYKCGADVRLGTSATSETIKSGMYDAVICAMGASPKVPDIDGIDTADFWLPTSIYGRENELGKRVVIVGGSEIGVETGIYLSGLGHEVTLLTRKAVLASESDRVHYYTVFRAAWENEKNLTCITEAKTTRVASDSVEYVDNSGQKQLVTCDSVIISGGMEPRFKEVEDLSGIVPVIIVGDNKKSGNIRQSIRSGFSAASAL